MNFFQIVSVVFLVYSFVPVNCQLEDVNDVENKNRTPIYIIANMANTISEAETFLADGANGLQIDVQFSPAGIPKTTQHGIPCYCGRDCMKSENFKDYLEFLRRSTTPGMKNYIPQLSVVLMNLKIGVLNRALLYTAGEKLADDIINYLYARGKVFSRAWIILGLPDTRSLAFVRGFRNAFKTSNMKSYLERFGYSVERYSRPDRLKSALRSAGVLEHVWVGSGNSNCKRIATPQRVIRLASERELIRRFGSNFVDKIYSWTIDLPNLMRENLRLGMDAIITNKPNQMKIILKEAEFEPYMRLAEAADVPWKWNTRSPDSKSDDYDDKSSESRYRIVVDEIDKELEALNRPAENGSKADKLLKKMFSDTIDDYLDYDKNEGTFLDKLVDRLKNLFS